MTALVNGLLGFGIFAIPMMIAVILRRLARNTTHPETLLRSPTTDGGMSRWSTQRHGDELVPRQATFALFDACAIERTAGDRQAARCKAKPWLT